MAVGANRHQVLDRVQPVALPKRGERPFMVNVDKAFADLAVSLLKINIAHGAPCPVMANVCEAGCRWWSIRSGCDRAGAPAGTAQFVKDDRWYESYA